MYFYRGETVTLSRQDLYKKVWKTSAVQLAKELGISDVAIAKLCKKHKVPKPPLGYWARIDAGQKVQRPALPRVGAELDTVRFHRCQPPEDRLMKDPDALAQVAAEKDAANQIIIAEELTQPHALVERTAKSLSSAAADERGIVRPRAKQCLDVAVSKAQIDRAMRIMDAILKAFDKRGLSVAITDTEDERETIVTVLDEPIRIGLSEKTDCKKRPPTAEQLARQAKYSWATPPTIYDYSPSGKLKLSILTGGYDNLRRNWTDLVHQRVENCLNRFMAALVKVAEREKAKRIEAERREREWQEETRRREEEAQRVAEEKARREDLDSKAYAWRKSQRLREYISAVESAAIHQKFGQITPDSDLGRWLDWAKRRAEHVDPIDAVLRGLDKTDGDQDELDDVEAD